MSINIGSSVFWNEIDGAGAGMWSGVVKARYIVDGVEKATIYCDGIIVPTMMRGGIQGPNPWTPEVQLPLAILCLRNEAVGDYALREAWEAKKLAYKTAEMELSAARLKVLRARYSFVHAGMRVSQDSVAGKWVGTVVSVDWNIMFVLVEGGRPDEPITQYSCAIQTLVFH